MATFTCPFHNTTQSEACPQCVDTFAALPDPVTMTGDERAAELTKWGDNILTVDFSTLHARIEALVGRPVWTHEMAGDVYGQLVEESRTRPGTVDLVDVIGKFPADKPVVVVGVE